VKYCLDNSNPSEIDVTALVRVVVKRNSQASEQTYGSNTRVGVGARGNPAFTPNGISTIEEHKKLSSGRGADFQTALAWGADGSYPFSSQRELVGELSNDSALAALPV
jgi:predicted component of type VI protein secretion system